MSDPTDPMTRRLRAGHRAHPLGLPVRATHLSWRALHAQERAAVTVRDASGHTVWATETDRPWATVPEDVLQSRGRYGWTLEPEGGPAADSWFELGLADASVWSAQWVQAPAAPFAREGLDPVPCLRRTFEAGSDPARHRLYITALGLYRVWLNGVELTDDAHLRPGWTDYRVRVHHQSYDVDGLLRPGTNVLSAMLAKGWYAGRLGLLRRPGFYGSRPALLAQLDSVDDSGRVATICATDERWTTTPGPIQSSDLLRGETVDLRREPRGWHETSHDEAGWVPVEIAAVSPHVVAQPHDSVRTFREHPGVLVHEHARGPLVFDFGQNIVGWTRVSSPLLPDTEVVVRHGEILTPSNLVYRDNLRGAFQEDTFVDDGEGVRTLEPSFTSHGFRYAEVWGLPSADEFGATRILPDTTVTGISIETGHGRVGQFTASDERLTRWAEAVEWTVRDNFLEVATDCPQRDERHGWLGDAGVISPTATYFFDTAAFLDKFATDAADDQGPDGEIRSYVPAIPPADSRPGAPGWADGYVRMVHLLVERYGDVAAAERHVGPMTRFAEHVLRHNPDGLRVNAVGADFADWLSLPERDGESVHPGYAYTGAFSTAPKPVVGTAHTYRTFVQFAEVLERLGRDGEAQRWRDEAHRVREAYRASFLRSDLTVAGATQTVYAQAIGFGLVDGDEAVTVAEHLRDSVRARGHVTTGIHGVEHVLPALARHGQLDTAIELLLRDEMPSWLYMLAAGGTTVWEKWDGIRPDGSLATAEMNSFNHCALGAVGAFLFEDLLGLRPGAAVWDGTCSVEPVYTTSLEWVEGSYDSPAGAMASRWQWDGDVVRHTLTVPSGVRTSLHLPAGYHLAQGGAESLDLAPGRHELTIVRKETS